LPCNPFKLDYALAFGVPQQREVDPFTVLLP
jgi:hypothetical protein